MIEKLKQNDEKVYYDLLDKKAKKLRTSMSYYFKSKQSYENLLLFCCGCIG